MWRVWVEKMSWVRKTGGWGARRAGFVLAIAFACMSALAWSPRVLAAPVRDQVRAELLDRINRDRARHNLPLVALDEHASRVADAYCATQVETGTRGHFTTDGLSPYMRYSFEGIHDTVLENAASWSARDPVPENRISELAQRSHTEMIAEIPPDDGHRRAILDPDATHVGIGVSWGGREVRVIEALLRRHVAWEAVRQKLYGNESFRYRARLLDPSYHVDAVTVHYEPMPYRLTRERANTIDSYSLPGEVLKIERERPSSPLDAALRNHPRQTLTVDRDRLSFELVPSKGRGIYTIVVWLRSPQQSVPFAATNLAVLVEDAAAPATVGTR